MSVYTSVYITIYLSSIWSINLSIYLFRCDLCTIECNSETAYETHCSGKKHVARVKMQEGVAKLSFYLSIYLCYLFIYIFIYLSICISIFLSIYFSITLSISTYLSTFLYFNTSIHLRFCLSIYLCYLSAFLSIYQH